MGVVYMAAKAGKTVALKVILSGLNEPRVKSRFVQEVQSLSLLRTPYVAPLLDFDIHAKNPWYAVEYVSDMSLSDVIKTTGSFNGKNWWNLAQNLLMALAAIHNAEVIHRDLKPSNIMVSKGMPLLIDFGLAKPIAEGIQRFHKTTFDQVMGTPHYMSPEQWENTTEVDGKTDVWAIGVTLIDAAGGRPWGKKDTNEIRSLIYSGKSPDLSSLDPAQKRLVSVMLQRNPDERWSATKILKNFDSFYNYKEAPAAAEVKVEVKNVGQPNNIKVEGNRVVVEDDKPTRQPAQRIVGTPKRGDAYVAKEGTKHADLWPQEAFPLALPRERILAASLDFLIALFGLFIVWPIWLWKLRKTGLTPGRKIVGLVIIDAKTFIPVPVKRVLIRGLMFNYVVYGIFSSTNTEKYGWVVLIPIVLALPMVLKKRQTVWDMAFKTTVGKFEKTEESNSVK
jgi:uncharacterized RDD family membrane protein YckC